MAWDIALPLALLGLLLLTHHFLSTISDYYMLALLGLFGFITPALALLNFSPRRWRFTLGVAACLLVALATGVGNTIATERSFFGVYRILMQDDGHARVLALMNGTTLHGVKSLVPDEETRPMGYYSREGPFGRFLQHSYRNQFNMLR